MRSWSALSLALVACSSSSSPPDRAPAPAQPPALAPPTLPETGGEFAPALTRVESKSMHGKDLADTERCAPCHAEIVSEWRASAHAFASFDNPIYRAAVETLRSHRPLTASRMCGGCHDPALLVDGALDAEVSPDDPRARAGVGCATCHGIVHASPDGNGSYTLAGSRIELPASEDPKARALHIASAAKAPLRAAELCASCHRAFLSPSSGNAHFLAGADDFGPWARSVYAGSVGERLDDMGARSCGSCHMPKVDARLPDRAAKAGRVSSHRFLGGHTWLQSMRDDPETLRENQELLRRAVRVDIVAVEDEARVLLPLEGMEARSESTLIIDVVLENRGVGHHFPGSVRNVQDTWVDVVAEDSRGNVIASSEDHRLRAGLLDDHGREVTAHTTHEFSSVGFNHTLPPRSARLVRFGLQVPKDLPDGSITISASIRHKSRDAATQAHACKETQSARGKRWDKSSKLQSARVLDACADQPVTLVASDRVELSKHRAADARSRFERLYWYALALLDDVRENAERARPVLDAAFEQATSSFERAQALALHSRFETLSGRTEEAIRDARSAANLAPETAVISRLLAEPLVGVWRWSEAAPELERAALAAPRDDALWSLYARALGSLGRNREALDAAERALASAPRSESALLTQALAFGKLAPGTTRAAAALDAYATYREADTAPRERSRCSQTSERCRLERRPVHIHWLR